MYISVTVPMSRPTIRPAMIAPAGAKLPKNTLDRATAPITTRASAVYSPMFRAFCGDVPSLPLTNVEPITEAITPRAARTTGKIAAPFSITTAFVFCHTRPSVIAEMIEPT